MPRHKVFRRAFTIAGTAGLVIVAIGVLCGLSLFLSALYNDSHSRAQAFQTRACYKGALELQSYRVLQSGVTLAGRRSLSVPPPPAIRLGPVAPRHQYRIALGTPGGSFYVTLSWTRYGTPCTATFPISYPFPLPATPTPHSYPLTYP